MFEIEKIKHFACCQVCGNEASKNMQNRIYSIKVMNKAHQGTELHLCSNCCNALSRLIAEPDKRMYGIKVMSIDELDNSN